ncbi:AAA ATPase-like protein [Sediminihabitans luteus]|uniref:AAA ATPase-like protein n=1 Tax=Sediminihabitans luteus TaxID=1138585 RepID=A0A2M9CEI0_9CELL|nr:helix-turn-helix transcriptional regulator [Sediminihabitans luteus]PJJ70288.1 AAA ATPase-like protein [Sediminihabitans luteus]GII97760.1 transcriptional regulator [Sediminihabitans luteus]
MTSVQRDLSRTGAGDSAHARAPRRGAALDDRGAEVARAAATVTSGHGALVWTAEPGMGKSTLLELVVDALESGGSGATDGYGAPVLTIARMGSQQSPSGRGAGRAVDSLVQQVAVTTGYAVPDHLVPALAVTDPDYSYLPEVAAVALTEYLRRAQDGRTLVLVVDDLDLVDDLSRAVVLGVLTQRQIPFVVLATATDAVFPGRTPYEIEVRRLSPVSPEGALHLLTVERRCTVAPDVAACLASLLGGNTACIAQTAQVLSPEQMAGTSLLPDPLPPVPAVRTLMGGRLVGLGPEDRRLLLLAAISVVDRTDALITASGMTMEELAASPAAEHLALAAGRYRFVDPRLRSLVHGDASLADRTAAHETLADAHSRLGDDDVATWHTALATLEGDASIVPRLVEIARRHLRRGDTARAHEVAREAASHGTGDDRVRALEVAGTAALYGGHVHDAASWLRHAARSGDARTRARTLMPLVVTLTLAEGQVPDDVVERAFAEVDKVVRPGDGCTRTAVEVARGMSLAACLHVERGEASVAARLHAAARELVGTGTTWRDGVELAESWMAAFGLGEVPPSPDLPEDVSADHEALVSVTRALGLARADQCSAASRVLASSVAELAPVRESGMWFDGPERAVSPLVEAHLRIVQCAVDFWAGDVSKAASGLADAAYRLPVGLAFAGLGAALARRLDLARDGHVGALATALESTCPCPSAPPVRLGILVDRAIAASFGGRHTESATLLELAAEREQREEVRGVPVPGIDEVEAWVLAGRLDAAEVALARVRASADRLSPSMRDAVLARAEVALASHGDVDALRERAMEVSRRLDSPFERARTELSIGRALARLGDLMVAQGHLLSAAELFAESGAGAWAQVAKDELAALTIPVEVHHDPLGDLAREGLPVGDGPRPVLVRAGDVRRQVGVRHVAPPLPEAGADGATAAEGAWAQDLTERELDVARLVILGMANREVAERLYLSVRTVEVHLGRVFRKLGVRSRVELTVLAHRAERGAS